MAQGELNALQLEFDQTGAGPIVAAHLGGAAAAPPAVAAVGPVLTPVAGFVWVVAVAEGSRARGSLVPMAQVVAGHQAGSRESWVCLMAQ